MPHERQRCGATLHLVVCESMLHTRPARAHHAEPLSSSVSLLSGRPPSFALRRICLTSPVDPILAIPTPPAGIVSYLALGGCAAQQSASTARAEPGVGAAASARRRHGDALPVRPNNFGLQEYAVPKSSPGRTLHSAGSSLRQSRNTTVPRNTTENATGTNASATLELQAPVANVTVYPERVQMDRYAPAV